MIDIIIPTYNQKELLRRCVQSVRANTSTAYMITVADDNSPEPGFKQLLKEIGVNVVYNKGEQGFPVNCNSAVRETCNEFICLLNSDTRVCVGWLEAMVAEMQDHDVGIVGARLLYPKDGSARGGRIQHAGVARNHRGEPYHIFRYADANSPDVTMRREINAVTFACALIRRQLWDEQGGLDEGFVGGQFEDVSFCFSARKAGWKIVYQPQAMVYHMEHGSGEDFVAKTAGPNKQRFMEMWPDMGSDEHLFKPVSWRKMHDPQAIEALAAILHEFRGESLCYVLNKQTKEHYEHCRRLDDMKYGKLPEVEKITVREWAKEILKRMSTLVDAEETRNHV